MALQSVSKTYTTTPAPDALYPDTGGTELTDGAAAATPYTNAEWSGWNNTAFAVRIDMGQANSLEKVRFHFLNDNPNSIHSPNALTVSGSNDDSSYTTLGTYAKTTDWSDAAGASAHWSNDLAVTGNYRYIKFSFTPQSTKWIFLSEIEVYGSLGNFFTMF